MEQARYIGYEIKGLSNKFTRVMDRHIQQSADDLTSMQFGFLGYLIDNVPERDIFQRDLEEQFHIRRSTATGILQLMEKKGYIRRVPVAHDARLKKLVLTDKAVAYHRQVVAKIYEVEAAITDSLTEGEVETLLSLMDKVSQNLDRLSATETEEVTI